LDKLEKLIAEKRSAVEELRQMINDLERRILVAETELAAFEAASTLRPLGPRIILRGRQPGAISEKWKNVLKRAHHGGPWGFDDIIKMAAREGMDYDLPTIRDRVRYFVRSELMEGNPSTGFVVTDQAAARFGFNVVDASERRVGGV